MVDEVTVRGAEGRRAAWLGGGMDGESDGPSSIGGSVTSLAIAGEEKPRSSSAVGRLTRLVGDDGGPGEEGGASSSFALMLLEPLACRDGL